MEVRKEEGRDGRRAGVLTRRKEGRKEGWDGKVRWDVGRKRKTGRMDGSMEGRKNGR